MKIRSILSVAGLLLAGCGLASSQVFDTETQKLLDPEGAEFADFGWSVDVDGDTMVCGAPDAVTEGLRTGAAVVFRREAGQWAVQQRLVASDGDLDDRFGESVAVVGGTVFVGAPYEDIPARNAGAVYVFEWDGASWVEVQKLGVDHLSRDESFGFSLAADGDLLAVSAPFAPRGQSQGEVHVFLRGESGYVFDQTLTASDGRDSDEFGRALDVEGSTVVAGAVDGGLGAGAAYVYRSVDGFWVEEVLRASDGISDDRFGSAVALCHPWLAVAAVNAATDRGRTGSVYRFRWTGSEWVEVDRFVDDEFFSSDRFGSAVALDGDTLAVGGSHRHSEEQEAGRIYTYRHDGERWTELRVLDASDPIRSLFLGGILALDGDTLVAGTYRADDQGSDAGAAYVFRHTDLALDVHPNQLSTGDAVRLLTTGGLRGGFVVLYILFVDGQPFPRWITSGSFRADGHWDLQNTVPPGLEGVEMTLGTLGFLAAGEIGESNLETLSFR